MTPTILIVEDDPPTQMLLETLVQRNGYESVSAPDGAVAIELLGQRHFDAVILDLMMPQVSGTEVIDFLTSQGKRVPVILCTAAGPQRTASLEHGVVRAVVRKPFDIEALMDKVAELIGKQPA